MTMKGSSSSDSTPRPKRFYLRWVLGLFAALVFTGVSSVWLETSTLKSERANLGEAHTSPSHQEPSTEPQAAEQPRIKIIPRSEAKDLESIETDAVDTLEQPVAVDGPEIDHSNRPKGVQAMFGYAKVMTAIQTEPDNKGRFLKVEIYNTDFKYPLIRVAEKWSADSKMVARSAMVADHLMVRWTDQADPVQIHDFLSANAATIRHLDPDSNIMLIAFDGADPRALGRMLNTFRQSSLVDTASPDYIASNNPDAMK